MIFIEKSRRCGGNFCSVFLYLFENRNRLSMIRIYGKLPAINLGCRCKFLGSAEFARR
jgi:hypothetical protein